MHAPRPLTSLVAALIAYLANGVAGGAATAPEATAGRVERNVQVPMRDGVHLAMDLYFPRSASGPQPTILVRTPYDRSSPATTASLRRKLIDRGYVLAVESMRGRYESEGHYKPGISHRNDATDTVDWIASQPWSDGKIGTMGCSYLGDNQVVLAAARNRHHLAAVPMASTTGYLGRGRPWEAFDGGVFELAETAGWFAEYGSEVVYGPPAWVTDRQAWFNSPAATHFRGAASIDTASYFPHLWDLPIVDVLKNAGLPPTDYLAFVSRNPDDAYFHSLDWAQAGDTFDTPMLFFDSWYDYGPADALELRDFVEKNSVSARARDNQYIVIAPTTHCEYETATGHEHWVIGERDMGVSTLDVEDLELRWYDHWLRGVDNGVTSMPKVQYFLMGANEWRHADRWPVPGTEFRRWYLHSGGRANSRRGDGTLSTAKPGREPSDTFVYDPASPVPSVGGQACCTGLWTGAGAFDQSTTELRDDVLVYTGAPLSEGIEVTGPLEVVLSVSSSARDTDFVAKLVDVYPDGRAFNVQEGALRMRYRDGFAKSLTMAPDGVYTVHLGLHATANYFGPGHRVRLEVSSSSFPRFDRNLNTGGHNFDEHEFVIARNTVHHDPGRLSYVVLPVIPQSPVGAGATR